MRLSISAHAVLTGYVQGSLRACCMRPGAWLTFVLAHPLLPRVLRVQLDQAEVRHDLRLQPPSAPPLPSVVQILGLARVVLAGELGIPDLVAARLPAGGPRGFGRRAAAAPSGRTASHAVGLACP